MLSIIGNLILLSTFGCSENSDIALETLTHNGVERNHHTYIPAAYNNSLEVPMLINFHGGCMSASSQRDEMDMRSLADEHNFILVYPEGTSEDDQRQKGRLHCL